MIKAREIIKKILLSIGGLSMILVAVVLFAQTVARYCFHYSFFWADELCRYSMIWGAQLCAAVGVSERAHTSLDFIISKVKPRIKSCIFTVLDVLYIVFSAALFYYSFANIKLGMKSLSPGLGMPTGYVYMALTVSMFLTVFFLCFNVIDDIKSIIRPKEE